MTEGKNGKQLTTVEEQLGEGSVDLGGYIIERESNPPCPICGLFHDDWCKMKVEEG